MKKFAQICLGAFGVLVFSNVVLAQDPFVVGPDVYKKLAFENDRVRIAEITFKPGDKIAMHSHPDHYIYVLSDGKLVLSYPDGTTKDFEGKAGDVAWIPAESHAAQNVGTTEFKALVVELKEAPKTVSTGAVNP